MELEFTEDEWCILKRALQATGDDEAISLFKRKYKEHKKAIREAEEEEEEAYSNKPWSLVCAICGWEGTDISQFETMCEDKSCSLYDGIIGICLCSGKQNKDRVFCSKMCLRVEFRGVERAIESTFAQLEPDLRFHEHPSNAQYRFKWMTTAAWYLNLFTRFHAAKGIPATPKTVDILRRINALYADRPEVTDLVAALAVAMEFEL